MDLKKPRQTSSSDCRKLKQKQEEAQILDENVLIQQCQMKRSWKFALSYNDN